MENLDNFERALKGSFVGAANQLTQLYTNSLQFQKQSFMHGYNRAVRDMIDWLLKVSILFCR